MKLLTGPPDEWARTPQSTSLCLGVFDGVHIGHRTLLDRSFANSGLPTVVTFDPHPVEVLTAGVAPRLITNLAERLELLEGVGTELVAVLDLADVRYLAPEIFVESVLIDRLNVGNLTVGRDFHFGRDRVGDVAFLTRSGEAHGFSVHSLELVESGGVEVSSSRIRDLIETGQIGPANELLGSYYRLSNVVVDGDRRGRTIGFPTANIRPPDRKVIPGNGVYAAVASIGGSRHIAAVNVGVRPTFGGGERLVEAYILDFDENIYGRELTLEFVEYLRPELDFAKVEDLITQMAGDVEQARDIVTPVMG
jgi:riboflavin kinase / FMN adenylyltransferase